jgi:hypothetical protein
VLLHRVLGKFFLVRARHRDGERRLSTEFEVRTLKTWLVPSTVVTGFGGVGVPVVALRPGEIAKRFGG